MQDMEEDAFEDKRKKERKRKKILEFPNLCIFNEVCQVRGFLLFVFFHL
jgi:hypothetical protein